MKTVLGILVLLTTASAVVAQDTDFQARLLIHEQWIGKSGWGIGAWQNVPDFTREGPFRALLVAGPMYKAKNFWIEFMGGGFVDAAGQFDPVLNVRSVARVGRLSIFNEALYTAEARTLLLDPNLTFQVRGPLWLGVESDLLFKEGRNSLGAGLRAAIKFSPKATVAVGYQVREGPDIVRLYVPIAF